MCVTTVSKSTCPSRSSGAWRFTRSRNVLSVFGFVIVDLAHQFVLRGILHRGADSVTHVPCRTVRSHAQHSLNPKGAGPLRALGHDEDDLEPLRERVLRVLEDGPRDDGEAIAVLVTLLANPVEGPMCRMPDFRVAALGAYDAVRPAALRQVALAGVVIGEPGGHLVECHGFNLASRSVGVK